MDSKNQIVTKNKEQDSNKKLKRKRGIRKDRKKINTPEHKNKKFYPAKYISTGNYNKLHHIEY